MPVLIEIKARCPDPERVRSVLASAGARRVGLDHQVDTYYGVERGRLKLRRGNIENNLIYYQRADGKRPKRSDVSLYPSSDPDQLHDLLSQAFGVWRTVDKKREIYFHENVKLHVDEVEHLGAFVEIEVIEDSDDADEEHMRAICRDWMLRLGVREQDLVATSYSDLIGDED